MGFWTRPGPWVEVIVVCLRSELLDKKVATSTTRTTDQYLRSQVLLADTGEKLSRVDRSTRYLPGVGNPRAAARTSARDRQSDSSCMQISFIQLILRFSPPADHEFRIPAFHIHVPIYCARARAHAYARIRYTRCRPRGAAVAGRPATRRTHLSRSLR
eukprot:COSAG02_NODE_82_length_39723_cov_247.146650_3_plen_158_part_00